MRFLLLAIPLIVAGCVTPPVDEAAAPNAATASEALAIEPVVLDWKGHVSLSELGMFMHRRPTEDVFWPIHQEGFLLDVQELPQAMEVAVEWTNLPDGARQMIMLHSHKAEGTNAYVEHVTEFDEAAPKCLRVPAADLAAGHWQVMIHQDGATNADFTLKVITVGGKAVVDDSDLHGHKPEDGAFEVEEHEIEPCQLYQPAEAAAGR